MVFTMFEWMIKGTIAHWVLPVIIGERNNPENAKTNQIILGFKLLHSLVRLIKLKGKIMFVGLKVLGKKKF